MQRSLNVKCWINNMKNTRIKQLTTSVLITDESEMTGSIYWVTALGWWITVLQDICWKLQSWHDLDNCSGLCCTGTTPLPPVLRHTLHSVLLGAKLILLVWYVEKVCHWAWISVCMEGSAFIIIKSLSWQPSWQLQVWDEEKSWNIRIQIASRFNNERTNEICSCYAELININISISSPIDWMEYVIFSGLKTTGAQILLSKNWDDLFQLKLTVFWIMLMQSICDENSDHL